MKEIKDLSSVIYYVLVGPKKNEVSVKDEEQNGGALQH
jgi:hypothetical protein